MRVWFISLFVLSLLSCGSLTFADESSPVSSLVYDLSSPGSATEKSREIFLAADSRESSSTDSTPPAPLTAAPPADPDLPIWGQYLTPMTSPALPPVEYSLIGPPQGVIQHSDSQEYRAVVSDPNTVLNYDASFGQTVDIFRPDGMAPIGMFGDHTLPAGTAFISYRYLQNSFDQNYVGSHRTGPAAGYPFSPTSMMQNSQIALVEYGVTQDFTMLAYLPFQHNSIDSQTSNGDYHATFTNPGDIRIQGLLVVRRGDRSQSHVNFGLSLPVGFLEWQNAPGGSGQPFPSPTAPNNPYQLRTSSGTYDLLMGYTYRKQTDYWTFGGQANAVIPTGKNTLNYELGNQVQLTAWASRRWTDCLSTSARLDAHWNGTIRGADPNLNTDLSPANQANAQARQYLNGLLGVNYLLSRPGHRIREQRLFLESGVPLYQWVEGQQVGLTWILNAGWGMAY